MKSDHRLVDNSEQGSDSRKPRRSESRRSALGLEDLGYSSLEAGDAHSGLTILRSNPRIDLLVTDVGLPGGMNGRQFAEAARALRPDLKILFITGYAENTVISQGHLESGVQILIKPFAMEALGAKVSDIIRHSPSSKCVSAELTRRIYSVCYQTDDHEESGSNNLGLNAQG
jgi:CheY-like chemotaxis protein